MTLKRMRWLLVGVAGIVLFTWVTVAGQQQVKKIDDKNAEATMKRAGKVVVNAKRSVSKDGKVMTGTNAKGEKLNNVTVFDKQ